jgi:hypothetical protein
LVPFFKQGHGVTNLGEGLFNIVSSYGDLSASPDLDIGEGFVPAGPAMDSGSKLPGTYGFFFLFPGNKS